MKSVENEFKESKAQLEKIQEPPAVMQVEEPQRLKEEVEVTVRKSFANNVKKGGDQGLYHYQPTSWIRLSSNASRMTIGGI